MKWDHDFPFFMSQKRSRFSPPLNLGTPPNMWPDTSTAFEKIQLVRLFGTQRDLPLNYRIHAHGIFTYMNSLLLWQFIYTVPFCDPMGWGLPMPEYQQDHQKWHFGIIPIYICNICTFIYIYIHITCGNTASTVATCVKIAMPRFFLAKTWINLMCCQPCFCTSRM